MRPTKKLVANPYVRRVTFRLRYEEILRLETQVEKAGINRSEYLRRVALGYPIKAAVDVEQIGRLPHCRADLGRLDGLFKQGLKEMDNEWRPGLEEDMRALLHRIEDTIAEMRERVKKL